MEDGTNGWNRYVGKILRVVYEDGKLPNGNPHYSTKQGEVIDHTDSHLIMAAPKEQGILKEKILRYELVSR